MNDGIPRDCRTCAWARYIPSRPGVPRRGEPPEPERWRCVLVEGDVPREEGELPERCEWWREAGSEE